MVNVLIATSEAVPFAKTGGLADVSGALPGELLAMGHNASLIMPAYRSVFASGVAVEPTGIEFEVPVGRQTVNGRILKGKLPDSQVDVYFIDQPKYFDRPELYGENGVDYRDNCERFVFFCRAVMECIRLLDLKVDVLHCNDWQTSLIPAIHDAEYRCAPGYEGMATLLTIHNLAYQGVFWHWDMLLTGLDWRYFNWKRLEYYGDMNLLKGGIVFADALNTVSPSYAEEIQRSPLGCGLEGALSKRKEHLSGILNGVDYNIWNPATDPLIPQNYTSDSWETGKAECKAALQSKLGLAEDPRAPLFGVIGRLVEQKGIQLILEVMDYWVRDRNAQWVFLGTGQPEIEKRLREFAEMYPSRVAAQITFSNELAHQIEAGSDVFLMPSRYEPCGLNQMYSLKYGTVPVVHATGGLRDTITNTTEESLTDGTHPNGFVFYDFRPDALHSTLEWAAELYSNRPEVWKRLVTHGMNQDWSWRRSAEEYVKLYEETIVRAKEFVCA